ncbi:MAG: hypothetical protein J5605_06205, partial [Bacteroidales bacterium]|nr:hypothetical protein [Bacteroidales bacterium]
MDIKKSIEYILLNNKQIRLVALAVGLCVLFFVSLCQTAFAACGVSPNQLYKTFQHEKVVIALPAVDTGKRVSLSATDTARNIPDSLRKNVSDTAAKDSASDTSVKKDNYKGLPISKNAITDIVKYKAKDSVVFLLDDRKATLFKDGSMDYQDVNLEADSISVDFHDRMLYANGLTDTNGAVYGRPKFKDGNSEYNANGIVYNFDSKKGLINSVI